MANKQDPINKILQILRREIRQWKVPIVGVVAAQAVDRPFETLVSTILSLRTKDAVTEQASRRLLGQASTPVAIAALPVEKIEELIYPVGFYHTKARSLVETCRILIEDYSGKVPREMEELLKLPGVGRKTANLVITLGHDDYGICVDTHVHRISNRWGYVKTKTPEETEFALRRQLPRRHWKTYNDLLVTFGQNLCVPISPWCSKCPVRQFCKQVNVHRFR
jgi:endonuclease III